MANELVLKKQSKKLLAQLEDELQSELINQRKDQIKKLMKEIKMTEILLANQKKKLADMLSTSSEFKEEDLLFGDN